MGIVVSGASATPLLDRSCFSASPFIRLAIVQAVLAISLNSPVIPSYRQGLSIAVFTLQSFESSADLYPDDDCTRSTSSVVSRCFWTAPLDSPRGSSSAALSPHRLAGQAGVPFQ